MFLFRCYQVTIIERLFSGNFLSLTCTVSNKQKKVRRNRNKLHICRIALVVCVIEHKSIHSIKIYRMINSLLLVDNILYYVKCPAYWLNWFWKTRTANNVYKFEKNFLDRRSESDEPFKYCEEASTNQRVLLLWS